MQTVADDRLHAALAIGATRLLVRQDVFQRDHLGGQRREIFLCRIDDGQPLVQLAERLPGAFCLVGEADAEPLRHLVEAVVEGRGQGDLGALRLLGETSERAG